MNLESSRRRPASFRESHVEATSFVYEIVAAADALREARDFCGAPALHFGVRSRLLRAIERCGGAPTFTDLGRLLDMSRQAAREHALRAAGVGLVELFQSPDDRRAWQVMLTPAGRRTLEEQRMPPFAWLSALLNGLEPEAMRSTEHVLRVLRLRLERSEEERRLAARAVADYSESSSSAMRK